MAGIKQAVGSIPIAGPALRRLAGRYAAWRSDPIRRFRRSFRRQENVSVLQIGSNDGIMADPVHHLLLENPSWHAVFVEPVPFLFERLRQNYPLQARFHFVNAAISETAGTLPFYHLAEEARARHPDLPLWAHQLGSFDPGHIVRFLGDRVSSLVVQVPIPTLTLGALLESQKISRLDLLHLDTEGHDWVILRQLNFAQYSPQVIMFEHRHLSPADKLQSQAFLAGRYRIADLGCDYYCQRRT